MREFEIITNQDENKNENYDENYKENLGEDHKNPEKYIDFDGIVDDLSHLESPPQIQTILTHDSFVDAVFHGSLGFAYSFLDFEDREKDFFEGMQGLEINFGINLFSPYWVSEGVFRFFSPQEQESENFSLSVKEFNLKLIHKPYLGKYFHLRLGAGVLTRYLNLRRYSKIRNRNTRAERGGSSVSNDNDSSQADKKSDEKFTTPALNFILGLEIPISSFVSLGPEVEYAFSLTNRSIDRQSLSAIVRMNTYF